MGPTIFNGPQQSCLLPSSRKLKPPLLLSLSLPASEPVSHGGRRQTRLFLNLFLCLHPSSEERTWVKSGYFYAGSEIPVSDIDSSLFSHLICAFASIGSSTQPLSFNASFEQIFSTFTSTVKRKNPSITTLLSVWAGGEASTALASMIGELSSRSSFVESTIEKARLYPFSGIDLFRVLPSGSSNMTHLSALLGEWRDGVDAESRKSGKPRLLLVMGVYCQAIVDSVSYPLDSIQRYLDWVHLIAYDYHLPTREKFALPHAALFDPASHNNTDFCITWLLSRGFPARKLVLGLPYHGYAWKLEHWSDDAIDHPTVGPVVTADGKELIWINFDDVEAIRAKVTYAKGKGLLGYNVFQVNNDQNWVLSRTAQEASEDQQNRQWFRLVMLISIAIVVLFIFGLICCLHRRTLKSKGVLGVIKGFSSRLKTMVCKGESLESGAPNLQTFRYATLRAATDNFSSENKLSRGWIWTCLQGQVAQRTGHCNFGMARIFSKDDLEANTGELLGLTGTFHQNIGKRTSCYYGPNENLNLLEYGYEQWKGDKCMEFIDQSLDDSSSSCKLMRCMQVALLCVQEKPGDRPSMLEVSSMLKNEAAAVNSPRSLHFQLRRMKMKMTSACSRKQSIQSTMHQFLNCFLADYTLQACNALDTNAIERIFSERK
ncbi:hypothetical protein NL676_016183 [Syzygium grande]|nr:hypothetical protein NL676_016183 [Syzygium grande]